MDDKTDLKKVLEVLKNTKQEEDYDDVVFNQFEGFINYDISDDSVDSSDEDDADQEEITGPDNFTSLDVKHLNKYETVSFLKPEEKQIIDWCADPDLKKLLLLNRQKNMQLIQMYKTFKDLLIECRQNIAEKNEMIKQYTEASKGTASGAGAWRLGAPYFKDRQLYCCPSNEDTLKKKRNKELSIYEISPSPKWSSHECDVLVRAVKVNYNINQQNEVRQKIKEATLRGGDKEELDELKERLDELSNNDNCEVPPLKSDRNIDWQHVAEVFIKDKHSALECRSAWHVCFHPSLNKAPWTADENAKLQELVAKHGSQGWDAIAQELGTNRSGFMASSNYFRNLHCKFKKGDFTFAEDKKLLEVVDKYRMGKYIPWVKVVSHFKYRTRAQLHHRYTYYLSQNDKKTGKFSDAEDVLIMICVDKFGRNFKKCTEYIAHRSLTQIKARYNSNVKNYVKKGTWTADEDRLIFEHVAKNGSSKWTELTKIIPRSRGQLRQRYNVVKYFLDHHPDATIDDVKRRKHNWSKEQQDYAFLRVIADQYKDKSFIPTLKELEKRLKLAKSDGCMKPGGDPTDDEEDEYDSDDVDSYQRDPERKNVDDMLTNFFSNCYKAGADAFLEERSFEQAVDDVELLTNVLKVDLDVPEHLEPTSRLDATDVDILKALRRRRAAAAPPPSLPDRHRVIRELVPPNLHSTIGLRSLLIKNLHFRDAADEKAFAGAETYTRTHVSRIKFDIMKNLSEMTAEQRRVVEAEKAVFYSRFYSLFKWPSLLTLEGPTADLKSISQNIEEEVRPPIKRTYARPKRKPEAPNVSDAKKPKLDSQSALMPPPAQIPPSAQIPSSAQNPPPAQNPPEVSMPPPANPPSDSAPAPPLKLTPVTNKSVIENLLKDRNKKLFCFNKVQCGDKTKTVIKEVKLNLTTIKNQAKKAVTTKERNLPKAASSSTATSCAPSPSKIRDREVEKINDISQAARFLERNLQKNPLIEVKLKRDDDMTDCDSTMSSASSVTGDDTELSKLDAVMTGSVQSKTEEEDEECEYDTDLYDLQRLNIFLKRELEEEESDTCSEMSFTM